MTADEEALARLSGLRIAEFEALYHDFDVIWQVMQIERLNYAGRQTAPGAGRKYAVGRREQLLSVLLWSHLGLHPRDISRLLGVHVSTFARIRQRVLAVLDRLDVEIEIPDRNAYKEIDQLAEAYPELRHLG
ncbi:MAG TPA: hypothetical protein EYH05_17535 [Anaerolineae bacterium]|nr:hypothetical protein [Anaerolineae bacterium]